MSWLLYESDPGKGLLTRVRKLDKEALAGRGPLQAAMERNRTSRGQRVVTWELSAAELLRGLGYQDERAWFVVDMKPNAQRNVSLYRLTHIWGHSYDTWTPVAVQLRTIFVDLTHDDPEGFKRQFKIPQKSEIVHEFLYLQGGTERDHWAWGRVGSVNGALLWPDAFTHFVRCISPYTTSSGPRS